MAEKAFKPEQITGTPREAEVLLNQGLTVPEASRWLRIVEQTYYRWGKDYGGMRAEQAERLEALEQEDTKLKRLVADITLDNAILKEATRETPEPAQETSSSRASM